jgi:hypothetical protein
MHSLELSCRHAGALRQAAAGPDFHAEFLIEFPPGCGSASPRPSYSLRQRPGAQITFAPKRPTRMDEENFNLIAVVTVHQNAALLIGIV